VRRTAIGITAVVVAALATISLRVVLEGRAAIADGDDALADRRPVDAIAAWESAARWYLPLAPHVDEAYDRLRDYAKAHRSMAAWRAVRRAALATRTLWQPHADDLAEANAALTELAAADVERAPGGIAEPTDYAAWHAQLLAADPRPSSGAAVLAICGIACWLVGMGMLLNRADRRRFRLPAVLAAIGAVVWIVGLYTA